MNHPPQNFANHTRYDPPFHFFMIPVLGIWFVRQAVQLVMTPGFDQALATLAAAALLVAGFKIRLNALRVQDRLICLEERLRMARVLPEPLRARVDKLTEGQLVGLRFASDQELSGLVEKTLAGNLPVKEIKKAVANWRPDYFRV